MNEENAIYVRLGSKSNEITEKIYSTLRTNLKTIYLVVKLYQTNSSMRESNLNIHSTQVTNNCV